MVTIPPLKYKHVGRKIEIGERRICLDGHFYSQIADVIERRLEDWGVKRHRHLNVTEHHIVLYISALVKYSLAGERVYPKGDAQSHEKEGSRQMSVDDVGGGETECDKIRKMRTEEQHRQCMTAYQQFVHSWMFNYKLHSINSPLPQQPMTPQLLPIHSQQQQQNATKPLSSSTLPNTDPII